MEQKVAIFITGKIISSLPEKYNNMRRGMRKDKKLDKLTDHLINKESLLNMHSRDVNTNDEQEVYSTRGRVM